MSTSIEHKKFVEKVVKGLKKAIDTLIDESIEQNDDLVIINHKGNIEFVKAKDLKK